MGLIDDAKAAEVAASKVVAELEAPSSTEVGTYELTQTATGYTLTLTVEVPATPAAPAGNPAMQ